MFIKIFQNVSKEREFLCWGLPIVHKKRATAVAPSNTRKNNHNNLNHNYKLMNNIKLISVGCFNQQPLNIA